MQLKLKVQMNFGENNASEASVLVVVERGGFVESIHRGHIAVVDATGRLLYGAGSPSAEAFMRSCAKFHQAIPLVQSGAADHFHFSPEQIAIACASHDAEPFQVKLVQSMLGKLDLPETALKCGPQDPSSETAARDLYCSHKTPSAIHNNCSGKHSGMLATALQMGAHTENYFQPTHPLQLEIARIVEKFIGHSGIRTGIDGCSVPTFYLSLFDMALMFARLASPENELIEYAPSIDRIWQSVTKYPYLISNYGGLDALVMNAAKGAILAKGGAEAVFCMAVKPSSKFRHGLGIAIKIEDGSGSRARAPVALSILEQLELLESNAMGSLKDSFPEAIFNRSGIEVGHMKPAFNLQATDK
ncbi:MAG: asparaginase [Verrucomicrobiota bacterium]